jgi:hypothetical protein
MGVSAEEQAIFIPEGQKNTLLGTDEAPIM